MLFGKLYPHENPLPADITVAAGVADTFLFPAKGVATMGTAPPFAGQAHALSAGHAGAGFRLYFFAGMAHR